MAKTKKSEQKEEKKTNEVTPVHFCIDEKDVQAEYDAGAFKLARAGGFMHYMTKGGYHLFVDPSYRSLYDTLSLLLDTMLELEKKGEKNETMNNMADFVSSLLFAPTVIFSDDDLMFKAFEFLQDAITEMAEKSMSELQGQDFEANKDFEEAAKVAEQAEKILKEMEAEEKD